MRLFTADVHQRQTCPVRRGGGTPAWCATITCSLRRRCRRCRHPQSRCCSRCTRVTSDSPAQRCRRPGIHWPRLGRHRCRTRSSPRAGAGAGCVDRGSGKGSSSTTSGGGSGGSGPGDSMVVSVYGVEHWSQEAAGYLVVVGPRGVIFLLVISHYVALHGHHPAPLHRVPRHPAVLGLRRRTVGSATGHTPVRRRRRRQYGRETRSTLLRPIYKFTYFHSLTGFSEGQAGVR